jgi:rRNA maturation endonuclease Nob1
MVQPTVPVTTTPIARKQSKRKKPVKPVMDYDEIEIEFRCNKCDEIIDGEVERCPSCGEEFGDLDY